MKSLIAPELLDTLCDIAAWMPPGAFVEIGVCGGGSAERLYEIAEEQGRALYLFDTFAGHPDGSVTDGIDDPAHPAGRFAAETIPASALQEQLPAAHIIVGEFPYSMADPLPPLAFVHCDCDLYLPTRHAIRLLYPLLVDGGCMLCDDTRAADCPGVRKAIEESNVGVLTVLPDRRCVITKEKL